MAEGKRRVESASREYVGTYSLLRYPRSKGRMALHPPQKSEAFEGGTAHWAGCPGLPPVRGLLPTSQGKSTGRCQDR